VNVIFGAVIDPDVDDEVRVTVIATGFEERKEKVELPEIRKWTPKKEPVVMKASERVLSKNVNYAFEPGPMPRDIFNYEDAVDLPAFLRKSHLKEL
jgi:cell division protein FtsZ